MNKMINKKIDISPPNVEQIVIGDYEFADDIPDEIFVKINFRMTIGKLIDSTIMQLYPLDLAHTIYNLFQRRN
jgi:flagellar motor switch protein FliN/FliY